MSNRTFRRKSDVFMRPLAFYDIEVFKDDWLICFEFEDGSRKHFHNKGRMGLTKIIKTHTLVGFNNHHYDDKIITKIFNGFMKPHEIKAFNDAIILRKPEFIADLSPKDIRLNDRTGKEEPFWYSDFAIHSFDCYKQLKDSPSLKTIEGRNGAMIMESEVDFTIDRKLTEDEMEEVIRYCYYDVAWAKNIYYARKDYWDLKAFIYDQTGEDKPRSFTWNTTAATKFLFNGFKPLDDKIFPAEFLWKKLPKEVREMFENDTEEIITVETKTAIIDFSDGGGHGVSKEEYGKFFENVELWDVTSLYPIIMVNYEMFGELTDILRGWLERRIKLKQHKNPLEKTYKLLINSLYGLTGDTYDAEGVGIKSTKLRKSVCMIGQTCLWDLSQRLEEAGCILVNVNTDGVGFINPDNNKIDHIKKEWEEDWNMELTKEFYAKLYQKDVNNYIGVEPDGSMKLKGGDVKRANLVMVEEDKVVTENNNFAAVDYALVQLLVNNIAPYDSLKEVYNASGLQPFCRLFNVNRSYKDSYGLKKNGERVEGVQKVNRILAVNEHIDGATFKRLKDVKQYFGPRYINGEFQWDSKVQWRACVKGMDMEEIEANFETRITEREEVVGTTSDNMLLVNYELSDYDISFEDLDIDFYIKEVETRKARWS